MILQIRFKIFQEVDSLVHIQILPEIRKQSEYSPSFVMKMV